jgi:general secretion pathway protein F
MATFRYVAIAPSGELTRGTMEADSEAACVELLRRRGSIPMKAEPAEGRSFLGEMFLRDLGGGKRLTRGEVTDMTRELAVMLAAGQDLDRALRFLVETARIKRVRRIYEDIRETVRNGATLAVAMARHPGSFPALHIGLVRAGESGGRLAPTLERLAVLLERQRSLRATVTSALVYPTLLVVAAIGSITLLLTQVLPQFVPLFQQNGVALPQATQIMIDAGAFLSGYWVWLLAAIVITVVGVRELLRRQGPRLVWDRLRLRIPIFGGLGREIIAARFTRTFGTLLANDVPLIAALGIARDTIGNLAAAAAVDRASQGAQGGAGLATALGEAAVFPLRTIYLLRLGDETAQLGAMALRAADIHEEQARIGIQRMVSLLVPAITIVMGAAIAGIVSSLLLAMLSLNDLAQ